MNAHIRIFLLTATLLHSAIAVCEQRDDSRTEFRFDADDEETEVYDYHSGYTYTRGFYHYIFKSKPTDEQQPSASSSSDAKPSRQEERIIAPDKH